MKMVLPGARMTAKAVRAVCLALLILGALRPAPAPAAPSFVDDSGQRVTAARPFKRIISLYGAHTENLFSLGLDREIIGVSPHESYPPAALKKPVFSYRDDPERFLAARPDLVLIRPMIFKGHAALVAALERAGVTVVSLQPLKAGDLKTYWRRLGLLAGRRDQAEEMIRRLETGLARMKALTAKTPRDKRPRVFFESIHRRMKTFAPGAMALFVLEAAGGVNLASDAKATANYTIADYGKERILSLARRMDVYLAQVGPMNRVTVEDIRRESGFGAIKAVREGRIYLVDEQIVSRPTLRLLRGVAAVHKLLYPQRAGAAPKTRPTPGRED